MLSTIFNFVIGWGGGMLIAAGATAVAVLEPAPIALLIPNLRRAAIEVAIVAAASTFIYGKGYHDGDAFKQGQWDAAVSAAVERGKDARGDAERDCADGSCGTGGVPNDQFNRD